MKRVHYLGMVLVAIIGAIIGVLVQSAVSKPAEVEISPPVVVDDSQLATTLHALKLEKIAAPQDDNRGGALTAWEDGALLLMSNGEIYEYAPDGFDRLEVPPVSDFSWAPQMFANPAHVAGLGAEDLVIRDLGNDAWEFFVSHPQPHMDHDCYTLAVSRLRLTKSSAGIEVTDPWDVFWESTPCVSSRSHPVQNAGSMVIEDGSNLLIASGDNGYNLFVLATDGREVPENRVAVELDTGEVHYDSRFLDPQSDDVDSGKVIRINLETGASEHVSRGHRNATGLMIDDRGAIWQTEHGPQGGDELNLIVDGRDYGYPRVSYGSHYDAYSWSPSEKYGSHDGYVTPRFAWVTSAAVSGLIQLGGRQFPAWEGDFMTGSLRGTSLFRLRIEDGDRAVFAEQIAVGSRIRDLAQMESGELLLKLDNRPYVLLVSRDLEAERSRTMPEAFETCSQCHGYHTIGAMGGPPLHSVVGRAVAGVPDVNYSDALRAKQGQWTEEMLREFLSDTQAFAPGSTMPTPALTEEELEAAVEAMK